jgi:hypothetical protein
VLSTKITTVSRALTLASRKKQQATIAAEVPLGAIAKHEVQERKGSRQIWKLTCRDFRVIHFSLPEKAPKIGRNLAKYNTVGDVSTVFAAAYYKANDDGWKIYQVRAAMCPYRTLHLAQSHLALAARSRVYTPGPALWWQVEDGCPKQL